MAVGVTAQLQRLDLVIGGSNVPAASTETFDTVSPTSEFVRKAGKIRVGNPLEHETQMGPVISSTQANRILTNYQRAHTLARRLQAGNVSINYPTVNPPEAPFGGYKQSGLGRELSCHAMDLYMQTKNVVVNLNPQPFDWYGRWPAAPKP